MARIHTSAIPTSIDSPIPYRPRYAPLSALVIVGWWCGGILLTAAAALSQEPGRAEGTFTINGAPVAMSHAAIYRADEGFYDENDPTWTLVFTTNELEPRDVDDSFIDPSLTIGVTWTSEFSDSGEPQLEVLSQTLRVGDASTSGGTYPSLEIVSRNDDAWVGRLYHAEEQSFFDERYQYDLTFHAVMLDPEAPIGEALPQDGGEPGAAYLAWTKAIHSGDLDAIRALVPEDMAAMLDEPDAAESIEMMALMTPNAVRILSGSTNGEQALLKIEGTVDGTKVTGEVMMNRFGGFWVPTESSIQ